MNATELVIAWHNAKRAETEANEKRTKIENEILKLITVKEEGRSSAMLTNTTRCIATSKLSYKVDLKLLQQLTQSWPESERPIKTKVEADESRLKQIRHERPELWKKLAQAITLKPYKTHITLEKVDGV